jgi:hypothetical protein
MEWGMSFKQIIKSRAYRMYPRDLVDHKPKWDERFNIADFCCLALLIVICSFLFDMKRTVKDAGDVHVLAGNDFILCATTVAAKGNIDFQAMDNLLIMAGGDSVDCKSTATTMQKSSIENVKLNCIQNKIFRFYLLDMDSKPITDIAHR